METDSLRSALQAASQQTHDLQLETNSLRSAPQAASGQAMDQRFIQNLYDEVAEANWDAYIAQNDCDAAIKLAEFITQINQDMVDKIRGYQDRAEEDSEIRHDLMGEIDDGIAEIEDLKAKLRDAEAAVAEHEARSAALEAKELLLEACMVPLPEDAVFSVEEKSGEHPVAHLFLAAANSQGQNKHKTWRD